MSMKKTYKVTNRQQLIDLNGDTVNFDLTFTATAKNGESFEVVVVDQSTLDNNPNIEYKHANGSISGNIVSDKNIYQNYFLCLRAQQPCDVEVAITKQEIPPQPPPQPPPPPPQPQVQRQQPQVSHPLMVPPKNDGTNWKAIIIFILIIGAGIFLYYMYSKKKQNETGTLIESSKIEVEAPKIEVKTPEVKMPSAQPSPELPAPQASRNFVPKKMMSDSLLARLNSIPVK